MVDVVTDSADQSDDQQNNQDSNSTKSTLVLFHAGYSVAAGCVGAPPPLVKSAERYARSNESGKNSRLSRKYPIKLCPLRAATLAGQNAIAIQINSTMIAETVLIVKPNSVVANIPISSNYLYL